MPREIRAELRPQDQLFLDFSESSATHCVAVYTPTGELQIAPIESAGRILDAWRRPFTPESPPVFSVYVLSEGRMREALQNDADILASLGRCEPVLCAVESEDDAELLAEGLRGHIARLNATIGRH
jgi:hypothetical protein